MTVLQKDAVSEFTVILLDGSQLDIAAEPATPTYRLLDVIASNVGLQDSIHFGLACNDDLGNWHWLQNDRQLAEHDLPCSRQPVTLYFLVRFYVPSFTVMMDCWAVVLLYQHVRRAITMGQLECDEVTACELAAYVLQSTFGDYTEKISVKHQLYHTSLIPVRVMKDSQAIDQCEHQIIDYYKKLTNMSRGLAIATYLCIAEKLPTYGIHFYEVKDKKANLCWLGISWRGIAIYDSGNRTQPRKIFIWKQLENIYFEDKKFCIEVIDSRRGSAPQPSQEGGRIKVKVYTWLVATNQLASTVWNMAVSQHQFYLEWKHSRSKMVRTLPEVVDELNAIFERYPASVSALAAESVYSFNSSKYSDGCPEVIDQPLAEKQTSVKEDEATKAAQIAKYNALKERRQKLEDELNKKLELLYETCLKEAELTGTIPAETPRIPGKPPPRVRKRIGTEFTLSSKLLSPDKKESGAVGELEEQFEIQQKQMEAMLKLSLNKSLARSVRRKYRQQYRDAHLKLKELEEKLNTYRRRAGRSLINIPETVEDPDDLMSPQAEGKSESGETGSLASQQSGSSEGQGLPGQTMNRSKSAVPLSGHGGSLTKMESSAFDSAQSSMKSNSRSVSSGSLKDQMLSADGSSTPSESTEIRIYRKMIYQSLHSPQISSQFHRRHVVSVPSSTGLTSRHHVATPRGENSTTTRSVYSSVGHERHNRQLRSSLSAVAATGTKNMPSPSLSDNSDPSERHKSLRPRSAVEAVGHASSRASVTSSESGNASVGGDASTHVADAKFGKGVPVTSQNGSARDGDDDDVVIVEQLPADEHTRTWPRKRSGRHGKRRLISETQQQKHVDGLQQPEATPEHIEPIDDGLVRNLSDSLDLAEISPSKYGSKRDSAVDSRDSLFNRPAAVGGHASHPPPPGVQQVDIAYTGHARVGLATDHLPDSRQLNVVDKPVQSRSDGNSYVHSPGTRPLVWDRASSQFHDGFAGGFQNSSDYAEHILLSQGSHHQLPSVSGRVTFPVTEHQTPVGGESRTVQLVDKGTKAWDGYAGPNAFQTRPHAPYQQLTSSGATYSPSHVAGRVVPAAAAASAGVGRHAVDVLFDNLFQPAEQSSYSVQHNTLQTNLHWPKNDGYGLTPSQRSQGSLYIQPPPADRIPQAKLPSPSVQLNHQQHLSPGTRQSYQMSPSLKLSSAQDPTNLSSTNTNYRHIRNISGTSGEPNSMSTLV